MENKPLQNTLFFCPWGCFFLLLILGQNVGQKYSDTNGMHAGSFFVHVMFPFHSGMVTKLRFPDFCSQEIFVIYGGKIIFYNIVGKSGLFLVLTPFIHLSQFSFEPENTRRPFCAPSIGGCNAENPL